MQATWASPLHHVQLDSFRDMEPPGYWDDLASKDERTLQQMLGALCSAMHATVRAYSEHRQEVVLDTVLSNRRARRLLVEDLSDLPVYIVAVQCGRVELVRREGARGDRKPGLADSQLARIHEEMLYDFEVDTTDTRPEQCAASLQRWLASGAKPSAFARLGAALNAA